VVSTRADRALISEVRAALAAAADSSLAPGMQAYMKSAMPYYGVRSAPMRRLAKACIDDRPPSGRGMWEATVRLLFDDAGHREERYVALVLAGHRCARPWQDLETLPLYRHLVEAGAWWDVVDQVATDLIGPILRANPSAVAPTMRAWAVDEDLWVRRTAVISQVGAKDAVDLDLLADCLAPNLERTEFWLRKASGWALRDVAYRHPDWVRAFVASHPEMSGLTRREGTKHLDG
jgi:3-methyladenine DNA glycosylase AlkD